MCLKDLQVTGALVPQWMLRFNQILGQFVNFLKKLLK